MTAIPPENDNNGQLCTTDHVKRVIWPDVIRIIAVLAMIMLHAAAAGFGRFGARTVSWQVCNLYDSLVRFCVPVFVMVSGMFLLNPEREYDLKKLYFTKILRIATAYLFWAAFYSMIPLISALVRGEMPAGHGYLYIIVRGIVAGHFHLWFLFMITGLYIVTPLLRLIVKDDKLTIYFIVLGLIFVYGTNMANLFPPMRKLVAITITRLNVQLVAGFSCYFIWGTGFQGTACPQS